MRFSTGKGMLFLNQSGNMRSPLRYLRYATAERYRASISIDRNGVWGFYPEKRGAVFSKRGVLKYRDQYHSSEEYVEFIVSGEKKQKIQQLIDDWVERPPHFAIPASDCVTFVHKVCKIIGVRFNYFAILPVDAVLSLRRMNDQGKIYF
jgi:hypothetical protein